MNLAKYWLKRCSELHLPCQPCNQPAKLPLRILQTIAPDHVRLVKGTGTTATYACLSYKWGDSKRYLLDDATICDLEYGMSTHDLPRTFKEAIELTYELSLNYVWIDALCIKQDSLHEMGSQTSSMDAVYQGAALTIFAAGGDSADSGLGTVKSATLVRQTRLPLRILFNGYIWMKSFYVGVFYKHGYSRPKGTLPLFQRGWVSDHKALNTLGN
jgi:hypothetical protein